MDRRDRVRRRSRGAGWLPTLAGAALLVMAGFALGLVVGAASEDPKLVLSYLRGETEQVPLAALEAPVPDVGPEPARRLGAAEEAVSPAPAEVPGPAPAPVAAPPPARAPVVAPPSARGAFAIQVGAFREPGPADSLAARLRAKGFPVFVGEGSSAGSRRWRVRVGPMATRREAEVLAARLKREERLPTWVVADDR